MSLCGFFGQQYQTMTMACVFALTGKTSWVECFAMMSWKKIFISYIINMFTHHVTSPMPMPVPSVLCQYHIQISKSKYLIPPYWLVTIELPCWNIGNGFAMPCYTVMPLCRCINILFALDVTGLATSNIGKPYTSASCHTLCTGHHAPHVPSCTPTPLP